MIIERISVKNWRGYRELHAFQFEDGINLLAGRNEAGKSTLFEVLTRVLFDRHNSKTEEIRAIQPVGSSLGPEAQVEFQVDGKRYRAAKTFLQNPQSALYSDRGGTWELDHEGDAADAQLREILRGEATARTAARPEHRGLAQALWYLQSDGPVPEKSWSDGVKEGLQGLVELAARSPTETAVMERASASYREYWTPTGRVASRSDLGRLQADLPELEERLAALRDKAEAVESYRADLEEIQSLQQEKSGELEKAKAELAKLSTQVEEADKLEQERDAKEQAKNEAAQEAEGIQRDLAEIDERQGKIKKQETIGEELEGSLADATAQAKAESALSDLHARRWKEELEPTLKRLEEELRALRALERVRKLEKDQKRLELHLERVSGVETKLEEQRTLRAELVAPDEKEWRRFATASENQNVLEAKVAASAVRVGFEWTGKTRKVKTQPPVAASEDHEYVVTQPTEFRVEGVGKVRVRSGASALDGLVTQRDAALHEVREFLTRFNVPDADGMAALREERRELDRTIATLEGNLEETEGTEPDAKEELARVKRGVEEETRVAGTLPAEMRQQGGQWIRDQIADKEREKEGLVRDIEEEQEAEKAATKRHIDLVEARGAASTKLAEHKAAIKSHQERISKILESYGTMEQLRKLASSAEKQVETATADLEAFLSDYEEKVVTPKRLHEQAQSRVRDLESQLGDLRTQTAEIRGHIEEAADQGSYSQLADTEIEVDRRKKRIAVLKRRADGAMLLNSLLLGREKQRSAVLSGPIQELVNRWLRLLTEENYDSLEIDHDLRPSGVHMARYDAKLPLTSLSHGAREQVVVLLRLGIAVLVSKEERNLVVIDDRLVNADPVRMKRLCLVLDEAAKDCQIVIATCNDTPYAGLQAHVVRVPVDGNVVSAEMSN